MIISPTNRLYIKGYKLESYPKALNISASWSFGHCKPSTQSRLSSTIFASSLSNNFSRLEWNLIDNQDVAQQFMNITHILHFNSLQDLHTASRATNFQHLCHKPRPYTFTRSASCVRTLLVLEHHYQLNQLSCSPPPLLSLCLRLAKRVNAVFASERVITVSETVLWWHGLWSVEQNTNWLTVAHVSELWPELRAEVDPWTVVTTRHVVTWLSQEKVWIGK